MFLRIVSSSHFYTRILYKETVGIGIQETASIWYDQEMQEYLPGGIHAENETDRTLCRSENQCFT